VKLTVKVLCRRVSNLLATEVYEIHVEETERPWQKTAFGTDLANALSRRIHPGHILRRICNCPKYGYRPIDNATTAHFTLHLSISQLHKF